MIHLRRYASAAALTVLLGGAQLASAQNNTDWIGGTSNWEVFGNWSTGFPPEATFDEVGVISNGGTAIVNTNVATFPGAVILGFNAGETGSLTIQNGGQLATQVVTNNVSNGEILVGRDGVGFLNVEAGGTISGRSMIVGGLDVGSVLTAGAAAGGVSNITIDETVTVSREVRVIGPNVNFSSSTFNWFATSTYIPQITAATHSAINVSGTLNIDSNGATLRPEFTNGVTPGAGDSWDLFDAATISGTFVLDTSAAPALATGQLYEFSAVPDGSSTNGVYGRLSVGERLVLNVNRGSGAMSLSTGSSTFSIDGYSIGSALGGLNPSGWNSLQDQAVSDWRESPQGGSANAISELKPTGSTNIVAGSPLSLGSVFQLPTPSEFGTELEDVTFEYYAPGGIVTQGIVNYVGDKQHNNLVLVVDPDTGEARMENQSALSVSIDGYKVESDSGSLLSGAGQWDSLDDQDVAGGDWRESNPTANALAELKPTSSTLMSGGSNFGFDLGALFQTTGSGGTEDLTFQYLFPGDTEFRDGVVVYKSLAASADFDNDGNVDGDDLALWESSFGLNGNADADNDGDTDGGDFLLWQREFSPTPATPVAGVVPEPSSLAMIACLACSLGLAARRRTA